jgi:nucleoside-diphosphate-sugar epimerase
MKTAVESGEVALFGEGEEIRPHLWIDDCVNWILEASLTKFDGLLDIVPRDAVSFRELAEMVAVVANMKVELRFQPRRQAITHRKFSPIKRELLWPHLPATKLFDSLTLLAREVTLQSRRYSDTIIQNKLSEFCVQRGGIPRSMFGETDQ